MVRSTVIQKFRRKKNRIDSLQQISLSLNSVIVMQKSGNLHIKDRFTKRVEMMGHLTATSHEALPSALQ